MKSFVTRAKELQRTPLFFATFLFAMLIALWARAEQLTIAWDPNMESNPAGYRIHYGNTTGNYSTHLDVGNVTTYTITNLIAGETYYFVASAYDSFGNESPYSDELSGSVPSKNPKMTTYTIWRPDAEVGSDAGADRPVELGVKFRSDSDGYIRGIRFFKYAQNLGTHLGNLWKSDGQLLGSVTFTEETSSGWQQAYFATPIQISANTTYIASYHTTTGHWVKSPYFFTSTGVDNSPLHAPRSGLDGPNGMYKYGSAGSFPDQSGGTNYWVDIVFAYNIEVSEIDTDGDGLADDLEIGTYGTDPTKLDTDGDGIPDGQEVALWGDRWNQDIDGDGVINLLDWDSDGDGFSDGEELAQKTDPGDKTSKVAALPMEAGEVTVDHKWKKVTFSRKFLNPVVVAGGPSANDPEAAVVRVRNVTGSGFEISIQEWDCYDGVHAQETVGYLAVESGTHALSDNLKVEAGRFVHKNGGKFVSKAFKQVFSEIPVVMAAVTTVKDRSAATVRISNITTEGFKTRLQEQEANVQDHGAETIAYIAWQPSSGSFDGIRFEVDVTEKVVNHELTEISFFEPHASSPVFLSQMQSTFGSNPSNVKWQHKDAEGVEVSIAEETSLDKETSHTKEIVGYMAFSTVQ
jgi:hypothetical protein